MWRESIAYQNDTMRASVVIPTYERPEALVETVSSVCDQTADEYEILIVDDGSESQAQSNALAKTESHQRVTVFRSQGNGPAAARNLGWRASSGEFVLFTDDDCLVPQNWVERLTTEFEPEVGAVGGPLVPAATVSEKPVARLHQYRNRSVYDLGDEPIVGGAEVPMGGTANIAYRREALAAVNGFDETFPTAAGEDADLQQRVADAGYHMKYVPLSVEHNDTYDLTSFVSRTIRHGKGAFYFHRQHGPERPLWRIVIGLLASPAYFPKTLYTTRDPIIATLTVAERTLLRYGELQANLSHRDA